MRANTIVSRILELSHEDPDLLRVLESFRRSVTIMFTDITGSTAYFEKFGDLAGFAMVHRCNDLLRRAVEDHRGRVLKNIGDATMAIFESCIDGVNAAINMQRRLSSANILRSDEDRVQIRVALHYGSGIVKSDDVFGDVVNTASRVETVAGPEQIVISDCLHSELPKSMFDIVPLGRFRLKGKSEERELFEVRWNKGPITTMNRTHVPAVGRTEGLTHPPKLQLVGRSGTVDAEHAITQEGLTIGRSEANINFPDDCGMESIHAEVLARGDQVWVRDCNGAGNLYVRVVATYALENGNVIIVGSQLLQFRKDPDIVAAAARLGKTLPAVTRLLNEPAAEFVQLNRNNSVGVDVYPLSLEEVRFGRVSGLYTFPDDEHMSRVHARVFRRGEDFYLEDLGSRNGTFIRVRGKAPIPIGAQILVSHQTFRIVP